MNLQASLTDLASKVTATAIWQLNRPILLKSERAFGSKLAVSIRRYKAKTKVTAITAKSLPCHRTVVRCHTLSLPIRETVWQ